MKTLCIATILILLTISIILLVLHFNKKNQNNNEKFNMSLPRPPRPYVPDRNCTNYCDAQKRVLTRGNEFNDRYFTNFINLNRIREVVSLDINNLDNKEILKIPINPTEGYNFSYNNILINTSQIFTGFVQNGFLYCTIVDDRQNLPTILELRINNKIYRIIRRGPPSIANIVTRPINGNNYEVMVAGSNFEDCDVNVSIVIPSSNNLIPVDININDITNNLISFGILSQGGGYHIEIINRTTSEMITGNFQIQRNIFNPDN